MNRKITMVFIIQKCLPPTVAKDLSQFVYLKQRRVWTDSDGVACGVKAHSKNHFSILDKVHEM